MSAEELQKWLVEEGIRDDMMLLTRRTVRAELDNMIEEIEVCHADTDWHRLLFAGSILSKSKERAHQETALRIATGALTTSSVQQVSDAGAVLLGKLANSRAIGLAERRDLLKVGLDERLGLWSRIEAQQREMSNAVLIESNGHWLQVNDFQRRFWSNANSRGWLSVSAPTASGKTFVVLQWLVDQMRSSEGNIAIYLAPTRALVAEIESSLSELLGKSSGVEVSALPTSEKFQKALKGEGKLILVFTQERLHLLVNLLGDAAGISLLIVDEAHKIGDDQRGVILQDAIERVTRSNPEVKVVFIAPGAENPEELLADAPEGEVAIAVDSDVPTVLQNLIVAEQVPRLPKRWALTLLQGGDRISLGTLRLPSSPSNIRKRIAFIAAAVGERGGTLVYANGAAESEEIAALISQLVSTDGPMDSELGELADLARKSVHPKYALASLVERGVAFHYGNMPSLIRLEIERLFRRGKIRFLVCTSTLIEGVNLSCRTIVLRGPRKGLGHPMEPHDFWNLAGRAGRWGDEFQGNIICVDPHDAEAWPSGVPARTRFSIRRETDAILDLGDAMVEYLDLRVSTVQLDRKSAEKFERVGGYLLATYLRLGSITHASIAKRHSSTAVRRLDESLAALAEKIEIGPELACRHPGVSALGLQRLLDAFRGYVGDVENLVPAAVESVDSYDRFRTIMTRINNHLYPAFLPDKLVPLHALVVVQWLQGYSLASMIRGNIRYHKERNREYKLPVLIRDTMSLVEQTARFLAPKYFAAYMDVLHIHLRAIGREDLIDESVDFGVQLEFGVSTRTLLSLLELGLSRTTAVALFEKIARDDLSKDSCVAWVLERRAELEETDLPKAIVREIRAKLLSEDSMPGVVQ